MVDRVRVLCERLGAWEDWADILPQITAGGDEARLANLVEQADTFVVSIEPSGGGN